MARTARKTDTTTNSVLYLRVSTQEQSMEGHSLPMQEARLRNYCAMRGLTIVDMLIDAGVSGGIALEDREGGQRMLALVKAGAVSHIVALKLDRLFRSCVDCLQTTEQWDKKGLALHLVDIGGQAVDSSSAMGRFVPVQVMTTEITPQLVTSAHVWEAETVPLRHAGPLRMPL